MSKKLKTIRAETTYKLFAENSMFGKYMSKIVEKYNGYKNNYSYNAYVYYQNACRHSIEHCFDNYQEAEKYIEENFKELI